MALVLTGPAGRVELGERSILLGSAAECDVNVGSAERAHARIEAERFGRSTHYVIEVSAPCRVGKVHLAAGDRRLLVPGSTIEIAGEELRIEEEQPSEMATRDLALAAVKEWTEPSILVVQGPAVGSSLELAREKTVTVGRSAACDLDVGLDDAVSRVHVEISRRDDQFLVRDLGSAGGTFLGRARLERLRPVVWTSDRMLRIGKTVLALRLPWWLRRRADERDPCAHEAQRDDAGSGEDPVLTRREMRGGPSHLDASAADASRRLGDVCETAAAGGSSAGAAAAIAAVPAGLPRRAVRKRTFGEYILVSVIALVIVAALVGLAALSFV